MKDEHFILNIVKKIENLKEGVISYAYKNSDLNKSSSWWEISVSDYDLYVKDIRFKKLMKAWYKIADANKIKIVFICGWVPTEERLIELANDDNLILNV